MAEFKQFQIPASVDEANALEPWTWTPAQRNVAEVQNGTERFATFKQSCKKKYEAKRRK